MKENKTIEELAEAFAAVGDSTVQVTNGLAAIGQAISVSWIERNIIRLSEQDLSESGFHRQMVERNVEMQIKRERQLYLKEIQRYTGYKINLQDLENK